MASTSETGHAKNVANFNELISFVSGYGETYNPSKASIKLTALQTLLADAKSAMDAVNSAMPAYSNAVSAREAAFEPLNKLITRVMNEENRNAKSGHDSRRKRSQRNIHPTGCSLND